MFSNLNNQPEGLRFFKLNNQPEKEPDEEEPNEKEFDEEELDVEDAPDEEKLDEPDEPSSSERLPAALPFTTTLANCWHNLVGYAEVSLAVKLPDNSHTPVCTSWQKPPLSHVQYSF